MKSCIIVVLLFPVMIHAQGDACKHVERACRAAGFRKYKNMKACVRKLVGGETIPEVVIEPEVISQCRDLPQRPAYLEN
jgi:hypothetical protein